MAIDNRAYHIQIRDYLRSDPAVDASGRDLTSETPLLGSLTGTAPVDPETEQDSRSYSGLAKGGIYHYTPKPWDPSDNRGVTPIAFSATSGSIKPTITVTLVSIPQHFQHQAIENAIVPSVNIWFYAPSHENGYNSIELMRQRVDALLAGYIFETDQGPIAQVKWGFNFGVQENHRQFPGSIVDYTRFDITTLRNP